MQSERAFSLSIEMFKGNKSYALSSDLFILPMILPNSIRVNLWDIATVDLNLLQNHGRESIEYDTNSNLS